MLRNLSKSSLILLIVASLIVSWCIVAVHYDRDDESQYQREILILEDEDSVPVSNNTTSNSTNIGLTRLIPTRLTPYTLFDWIRQSIGLLLIFILTFIIVSVVFMTVFMLTTNCVVRKMTKRLSMQTEETDKLL